MARRRRYGILLVAGLAAGAAAAGAGPRDAFDQRYGVREVPVEFPAVLNIGLQEDSDVVRMDAAADATLRAGGEAHAVPAGTKVEVRRVGGQAATIRYSVAIATYEAGRLGDADAHVARMRAAGVDARLVPWGARLVSSTVGQFHDHRRVFVVVEQTTDLAAAEASKRAWIEKGERPFLHEELVAPAAVTVQVRVGGQLVHAGAGPAELVSGDGIVRVFDVKYGVGQPWQGVQTRRYRGAVALAADRDGLLATVNAVELELYLQGVVPSEILPSSPMQALKSQAVAARGETLAKYRLRHTPDPFDLCAEVHCQVYSGVTKETSRTNLAVAATRGEVMEHDHRVVDAVYLAVCGGHTENNENIWSSPPDAALRGSPDARPGEVPSPVTAENLEAFLAAGKGWCKDAPGKFRWTKSMSQSELVEALAARDHDVGAVKDIVLGERGISGRLRSLQVVGTTGRVTIRKELPIRRAFGGLRSALFALDLTRGGDGVLTRARFRGAGWGHGVGLCQVGARAQAAAGVAYADILGSYYQGVEIVRVDRPRDLR